MNFWFKDFQQYFKTAWTITLCTKLSIRLWHWPNLTQSCKTNYIKPAIRLCSPSCQDLTKLSHWRVKTCYAAPIGGTLHSVRPAVPSELKNRKFTFGAQFLMASVTCDARAVKGEEQMRCHQWIDCYIMSYNLQTWWKCWLHFVQECTLKKTHKRSKVTWSH